MIAVFVIVAALSAIAVIVAAVAVISVMMDSSELRQWIRERRESR